MKCSTLGNKMRSLFYPIFYRYVFSFIEVIVNRIARQEYHGLSATMRLAKRYNGLAVLWEHRFYGDSQPFPVNVSSNFTTINEMRLNERLRKIQPQINGNS